LAILNKKLAERTWTWTARESKVTCGKWVSWASAPALT